MSFLGAFYVGQLLNFRVTWTLQPGSAGVTGTTLTLRKNDGSGTLGPFAMVATDGVWGYQTSLPSRGRWTAEFLTEPTGGVSKASLYVE